MMFGNFLIFDPEFLDGQTNVRAKLKLCHHNFLPRTTVIKGGLQGWQRLIEQESLRCVQLSYAIQHKGIHQL